MNEHTTSSFATGRFAVYRVLAVSPSFTDREGQSLVHVTRTEKGGAAMEVTYGDVPPALLYNLSNSVPVLDGPPAVREHRLHRAIDEPVRAITADLAAKPEFVRDGVTYLTVGYVRETTVPALPGRWAFWVAEEEAMRRSLRDFEDAAALTLDRAVARLLAADVSIDSVSHQSKAYFEPSGHERQPVTIGELTMTVGMAVESSGWDGSAATAIFAAVDESCDPHAADAIVANPIRWYLQAMNERDPLRRFLFAHWGIEALADKFCSEQQKQISGYVTSEWGIPAKSLFWPTPEGSDRPFRNIEFRFALMAWTLKGADADADIEKFKHLADLRNKLSHGSRMKGNPLPLHEGFLLLREYLKLVTSADSLVPDLNAACMSLKKTQVPT